MNYYEAIACSRLSEIMNISASYLAASGWRFRVRVSSLVQGRCLLPPRLSSGKSIVVLHDAFERETNNPFHNAMICWR